MAFEFYSSRVRTERGEEAVNAWLDTMRKRVRWRLKRVAEVTAIPEPGPVAEVPAEPVAEAVEGEEAVEAATDAVEAVEAVEVVESAEAAEEAPVAAAKDDTGWSFDRADIERDFATQRFAEVYEEVRSVEVSGGIPARNLSSGLLACVRIAGSHARKHPAILIPTICRLLETEHLSVFKREGAVFIAHRDTAGMMKSHFGLEMKRRQGYFRQRIDMSGWQREYWLDTDAERLPAALIRADDGAPVTVTVPVRDEEIVAQIWRVDVGRVPLLLLDSDIEENDADLRGVTDRLYGGDHVRRHLVHREFRMVARLGAH
jgi:hypothetical protein